MSTWNNFGGRAWQKQSAETPTIKTCEQCGTEIDRKARVCPHCRGKQTGNEKRAVLLVAGVVGLMMLGGAFGGGADNSKKPDPLYAKYDSNAQAPSPAPTWEYSPVPPEGYLDRCMPWVVKGNAKVAAKTHEVNQQYPHLKPIRPVVLQPRQFCLEQWSKWELQEQWHTHPLYGKDGSQRAF